MESLTHSQLFKKNPAFQELLSHESAEFVSKASLHQKNLPYASTLVPIHAGICLPGIDVFTESRSWYGMFHMNSLNNPTLKTSGFPAELMYPPGTRIDIAFQVFFDDSRDFVVTTSAVVLNRDQTDSLPLLQINQRLENHLRERSGCASSDKIAFASPIHWFESLDTFFYGIIKVTVPDTRSYAERTRDKLQSALDKIEGTPLDKLLFLQKELKVSYSLRLKRSVRDDYYEACVKLRECKRDVYAFVQIMDLDNPEHVFAFAQQGNIMKSLQMRVDTKKWILDSTPEAEKCMARPINLHNGRICLFYEPTSGVLYPMHASVREKKIYYKSNRGNLFPKLQTIETELKEVHARIRGGATIRLSLI
jgi:hypothetical protein